MVNHLQILIDTNNICQREENKMDINQVSDIF
jgi:hypothetical protein